MNQSEMLTAADNEKRVCLIVFKFASRWNFQLVKKFSLAFKIFHVYADDILRAGGSSGLKFHLNRMVEEIDPQIVVFDIDYYPPLDLDLISDVAPGRTKVAVTFDDLILHELNSITASTCDLVLTADPISVLRYREKAICAEYMPLEGSSEIYIRHMVPQDIDVLHFGAIEKADRKEYLDYLVSRGIAVSLFGIGGEFIPIDKLSMYISRAKIVINFSKTDFFHIRDFDSTHPNQYFLQFKGRVIEAGLCGTACISEHAPGLRLLFSEDEVPDFHTKEECYALVSKLLSNDADRDAYARKLHEKVINEFEDRAQMGKISKAISALDNCYRPPARVPMKYRRLVAKSRLARIATSPMLIFGELYLVLSGTRGQRLAQKILLVVEMLTWLLWHLAGRAAKRLTRGT